MGDTVDTAGVWLRDGSLLYILEETGKYTKGVPQLRNQMTVRVDAGRPGDGQQAEVEALIEKIHAFLVADAKAEAQKATTIWMENTYPRRTEVEFLDAEGLQRGVVHGHSISFHGDPLLVIAIPREIARVNPVTTAVKVISPADNPRLW
jgi:hypothetical protein